ncbi:MAG: TraR/DksA family transcriptional regulator [Lentisphaeraceae bacterium]|nr:TraR/DksA family transcriptional regulator [Lentisphaeraceae bacterium]
MAKRTTQIDIQLDEPSYRGEKRKRYEQLTEIRDQLVEQVAMISGSSLSQDHNAGEDMADIGSDNFLREIGLNVASEEGKKIFLIQDALKALETGKYGTCIDCKEVIAPARLDAIPYAKLCVPCKTVREENDDDYSSVSGIDKEDELTE